MMKQSELIIRAMYPKEYPLLREFLYQAIFLPEGTWPPSRSVIDLSKLPIYIADFGTQFGDHCLAAEVNGKIVGTAWSRIMEGLWPYRRGYALSCYFTAAGISRSRYWNKAIR